MVKDILIEDLSKHMDFVPILSEWHFKQWGDLTGVLTKSDYQSMISKQAHTQNLPLTSIATYRDSLIGSVNIVPCDMNIRQELNPWLSQLFVLPSERNRGMGSKLVLAAVRRIHEMGFNNLYLYTSGTLPSFYERMGWEKREVTYYKGKERTIQVCVLYSNLFLPSG
jgi:predicted N-acetyltransferase YhbS